MVEVGCQVELVMLLVIPLDAVCQTEFVERKIEMLLELALTMRFLDRI